MKEYIRPFVELYLNFIYKNTIALLVMSGIIVILVIINYLRRR